MHDTTQTSTRPILTACSLAAAVSIAAVTSGNASPLARGKALGQVTTTQAEVVPARWWHRRHTVWFHPWHGHFGWVHRHHYALYRHH